MYLTPHLLIEMYSISITLLLENMIKNCSKISRIEMNLRFILAMKSSGKYTKDGRKVNVLCIIDQNHQRSMVVVDHSRNFKGNSLFEIKKRAVKS